MFFLKILGAFLAGCLSGSVIGLGLLALGVPLAVALIPDVIISFTVAFVLTTLALESESY